MLERIATRGAVAPEFVRQVFQETSGNPLYTVHLVRRLVESSAATFGRSGLHLNQPLESIELPHTIRDVVWSRVAALGETTATLLTTAAVLGREFDLDTLQEVSQCTSRDLDTAIELGTRAGLLRQLADNSPAAGTRTVRFAHALVSHALYYELTAMRRAQLHAKAASVLAQQVGWTARPRGEPGPALRPGR